MPPVPRKTDTATRLREIEKRLNVIERSSALRGVAQAVTGQSVTFSGTSAVSITVPHDLGVAPRAVLAMPRGSSTPALTWSLTSSTATSATIRFYTVTGATLSSTRTVDVFFLM